jgi:ABC-type Mn2+/Zn2+ transport system permease subunit
MSLSAIYPYVQRGLFELLLLSVGAGVLGTWIVIRGLAFYSHAVAAAAFPGLVLAGGLGFAPLLGAIGSGALVGAGVGTLSTDRRRGYDVITALVLAGALALGVILASDVFESGSEVDSLLFGSLFAITGQDLLIAALASAATLVASVALGSRWLAVGFDRSAARGIGVRSRVPDLILIGLVGFVSIAALAAVGALMATALLVVPAVTTRLWFSRVLSWQIATVALTIAIGVGGVWVSVWTNAPPGATIATLAGAVFLVSALWKGRQ